MSGRLWWANEVDPWDVDEVDGRRFRLHKWVRHAADGSELARLDLFEDVFPDGRRVLGSTLGFESDVEADATDPADIREVAEVLEAASAALYAMADRGVDGVAS